MSAVRFPLFVLVSLLALAGLFRLADARAESSPDWRVLAAYSVAECFDAAESDADYVACPDGNAYEAWRELYVPARDQVRDVPDAVLSCAVEFDAVYVGAVRYGFTADLPDSDAILDELDLVEVSDLSQSSDGLVGCVYVGPAVP